MIDGIPNRPLYFYQKDIIANNYVLYHYGDKLGEHNSNVTMVYNLIAFSCCVYNSNVTMVIDKSN